MSLSSIEIQQATTIQKLASENAELKQKLAESEELRKDLLNHDIFRGEEMRGYDATIESLNLRVARLVDFVHNIANEIYPYPEQAVRKADDLLSELRNPSPKES